MTGKGTPENAGESRPAGWVFSERICVLSAVLVVTYLAYFLIFAPDIYYADWVLIAGGAFTDTWIDLQSPWPLMKAPYFLQDRIFGLNIRAFHIIMGILHGLQAILLYLIGNTIFWHRHNLFSAIIALIFLVYPTVYSQTHLTMLHMNCALFLALLHAYFLLRFANGGRPILMALSLLFLVLSVGIYEAHIGAVSLWAVIVFFIAGDRRGSRRLTVLSPIILVGTFTFWRWIIFEGEGGKDNFLSMLMVTPSQVLTRAINGYEITLGYGWTTTIMELLPPIWSDGRAALTLIGSLFLLSLASRWLVGRGSSLDPDLGARPWPFNARWRAIGPYALCCGIGLLHKSRRTARGKASLA